MSWCTHFNLIAVSLAVYSLGVRCESKNDTMPTASNEFSNDTVHQNESCLRLHVYRDDVEAFHDALTRQSIFIYIHLHFDEPTKVYENLTAIVDDHALVWALEGKGFALLTYPYDFVHLSLGTLGPGISHVNVSVTLPDNGCFQRYHDKDRFVILAVLIRNITNDANSTLSNDFRDMYLGKTYKICSEEKNPFEPFYGNYLVYNTVYYCVTFTIGGIIKIDVIEKHSWPIRIYNLLTVLALIIPLIISYFSQKNPPKEIRGIKFLAIDTNLPVGVEYLLFYSFAKYRIVTALRICLFLVITCLLGTLPYTVPLAFKSDYSLHKRTTMAPTFGKIHQAYLSMLCIPCMIYILIYLCRPKIVKEAIERAIREEKVMLNYLDQFKLIKIPSNTMSKPALKGTNVHKLKEIIYHYTSLMIKPRVWWVTISSKVHNFVLRCLLFLFLSIYVLVMNLPFPRCFTIYAKFMFRCSLCQIWDDEDGRNEDSHTFVSVMCVFSLFSCGVLLSFISFALFYIGEIIVYTFIGLLLNYDYFGAEKYAFVVAGIGSFIGSVNFYGKYCKLHRLLIENACELEEKSKSRENINMMPVSPIVPTQTFNANDCAGVSQHEGSETDISVGKYVTYIDDAPHIPTHLFESYCKQHQPIIKEVMKILILIAFITFVSLFAFSAVKSIQNDVQLPAVVGNFLVPVFSLGIIPFLNNVSTSKEEEKCKEKAKCHKIVKFLKEYSLQNSWGDISVQSSFTDMAERTGDDHSTI